jgi:tripartite-type tricarboxylate transporter receptor subunit TctC
MPYRTHYIFFGIALLTAWMAPAFADAAEDFYSGKQIRLLIATPAGGSYDAYARALAMHMPDHIPGHPTIIPENMPGAAGLKSANYVYNAAPKDGLVIGAGYSGLPTAQLLTPNGVQFDVTKFSWIGSVTKDPYVGIVWHTSPIRTIEDTKVRETTFGGSAVGGAGVDYAIIARELFGLKLKIVTGYPDSPDMKIAMQRGEIDGEFATGWGALNVDEPTWVRDGIVRVIVQDGFTPHPDLPGVPLLIDQAKTETDRQILELMLARQETSKPYFAPPGVPLERLAILRQGFDATLKDPAFLADIKKEHLEVDSPMNGDEITAFTIKLSKTPGSIVGRINQILTSFQNPN